MPRERRGGAAHTGLPARFSRRRVHLGCSAAALRAARERRLPLRGAVSAGLWRFEQPQGSGGLPRQASRAGPCCTDRGRVPWRGAGMPGGARLGRRSGLEPGQPATRAHEAAGDLQLTAPRRLLARAAAQPRAAGRQPVHAFPVQARRRNPAGRRRLPPPLRFFRHVRGRQPGMADPGSARAIHRTLAPGPDRRLQLLPRQPAAPPPRG